VAGKSEYQRCEARLTALRNLASGVSLTAYRSSTPKYATETDLVTGEGSRRFGGRWNPPGLAAIYASVTPETAMAETLAHVRYFCLPIHSVMPRTFVALDFQLNRVLDLTDGRIRQRLGLSEKRIVETDWRAEMDAGREPVTQLVGRAAADVGLEGLIVPSSAHQKGSNIVAFPACFLHHSRVEVLGASGLP
jgi:RES domain-containing protein